MTSFEGTRREQLRQWAQLPLENILLAIEEMQGIAQQFCTAPACDDGESLQTADEKDCKDVRQLKFFLEKPDDQA